MRRQTARPGPSDMESGRSPTAGMSGAQLADLLNEAAIYAARRSHQQITPATSTTAAQVDPGYVSAAVHGVNASAASSSPHEAGHAVCGRLFGDRRRVRGDQPLLRPTADRPGRHGLVLGRRLSPLRVMICGHACRSHGRSSGRSHPLPGRDRRCRQRPGEGREIATKMVNQVGHGPRSR